MTDSEILFNDPVSRLLKLIKDLKTYRPTAGEQKTIANLFCQVLGYDYDLLNAYKAISDTIKLVEKAELEIINLDDVNKEHYLEPFPKLKRSLIIKTMDGPIGNFREKLDNNLILKLEMASNVISDQGNTIEINQDDLDQIITDVNELSENVRKSSINPDLRILLLERLEEIRIAAISFWVVGPEGLRRAAELNLGFIFSNHDQITTSEGKDKKTWEKAFKITSFVFDVIKIGATLFQVTNGDLSKLLPSG